MTHLNRREAIGAGIAATVARCAAPALANAPETATLTLRTVPLAIPQYYRTAMRVPLAEEGDTVSFVAAPHPSEGTAISVVSKRGERIGYVPLCHKSTVADALSQGKLRGATISRVHESVSAGKSIPGWGAFHLDIDLAA